MADRKFIWLLDDTFPRRGPALKKGETYNESDFPDGVAATWIAQGAAKTVKESKKEVKHGNSDNA